MKNMNVKEMNSLELIQEFMKDVPYNYETSVIKAYLSSMLDRPTKSMKMIITARLESEIETR